MRRYMCVYLYVFSGMFFVTIEHLILLDFTCCPLVAVVLAGFLQGLAFRVNTGCEIEHRFGNSRSGLSEASKIQ